MYRFLKIAIEQFQEKHQVSIKSTKSRWRKIAGERGIEGKKTEYLQKKRTNSTIVFLWKSCAIVMLQVGEA